MDVIPEQCESSLLLKFAVVPTSLDRGVCLGAPTHKVRPRFEAVNAKLKAISFSLMVIARKMHRDLILRIRGRRQLVFNCFKRLEALQSCFQEVPIRAINIITDNVAGTINLECC